MVRVSERGQPDEMDAGSAKETEDCVNTAFSRTTGSTGSTRPAAHAAHAAHAGQADHVRCRVGRGVGSVAVGIIGCGIHAESETQPKRVATKNYGIIWDGFVGRKEILILDS